MTGSTPAGSLNVALAAKSLCGACGKPGGPFGATFEEFCACDQRLGSTFDQHYRREDIRRLCRVVVDAQTSDAETTAIVLLMRLFVGIRLYCDPPRPALRKRAWWVVLAYWERWKP